MEQVKLTLGRSLQTAPYESVKAEIEVCSDGALSNLDKATALLQKALNETTKVKLGCKTKAKKLDEGEYAEVEPVEEKPKKASKKKASKKKATAKKEVKVSEETLEKLENALGIDCRNRICEEHGDAYYNDMSDEEWNNAFAEYLAGTIDKELSDLTETEADALMKSIEA